jgi:hypothetical protein
MKMSKYEPGKMLTARIAPDVRAALERWAERNLSTMTAELNASVRLRAAQERPGAEPTSSEAARH